MEGKMITSPAPSPQPLVPGSSLELALKQIEFARSYTISLLAEIADDEWFTMPPGCSTHVAWQVGHLAMAEYGLCLFRQRGRAEIDSSLMTSPFRKAFSRGSVPEPRICSSGA